MKSSIAKRMTGIVGMFIVGSVLPGPVRAQGPATQPAVASDQDEIAMAPVALDATDSNHRINMAARAAELPQIFVLAPQQTGYTASPSPTLYWFLSADTKDHIDFAITEPGNPQPILKQSMRGATAGLHVVSLSHEKKTLAPGKTYKITASLTARNGDQQETVYSGGFIRVADKATVAPDADVRQFANAGLFFDALAAACRAIDADPANPHLRKQRESLLKSEKVFFFVKPAPEQGAVEKAMLDLLNANPQVDRPH